MNANTYLFFLQTKPCWMHSSNRTCCWRKAQQKCLRTHHYWNAYGGSLRDVFLWEKNYLFSDTKSKFKTVNCASSPVEFISIINGKMANRKTHNKAWKRTRSSRRDAANRRNGIAFGKKKRKKKERKLSFRHLCAITNAIPRFLKHTN